MLNKEKTASNNFNVHIHEIEFTLLLALMLLGFSFKKDTNLLERPFLASTNKF